jgi:hypothetical protein
MNEIKEIPFDCEYDIVEVETKEDDIPIQTLIDTHVLGVAKQMFPIQKLLYKNCKVEDAMNFDLYFMNEDGDIIEKSSGKKMHLYDDGYWMLDFNHRGRYNKYTKQRFELEMCELIIVNEEMRKAFLKNRVRLMAR